MALPPELFAYVRDLLREHAGNVLEEDKAYLVETRLAPLARKNGSRSVRDFLSHLRSGARADLRRDVVEALVIQETFFFRDHHVFDALRNEILPGLIRLRGTEQQLSLWSAACSSGQEPYSLAMLLREHLPALQSWEVRILASDLSRPVLERGREGRYTHAEMQRGLPDGYRHRYFRKCGEGWQIRNDLRAMVEYRQINLGAPWPELPLMDLVLLRNVLLYFDPASKARILGKVCEQLRPGGVIVLGGGESLPEALPDLERESTGRVSWFRKKDR
jgi:chemotaxis protein methyltransferase CheR